MLSSRVVSRVSRADWALLGNLLCGMLLSCSSQEHPPALASPGAGGGGAGGSDAGGGLNVGDAGSDDGLCGNEQIPATGEAPNLYFVVDRSGSMGDPLPGSPYSKYENARIAISVMLRAVGHRVRYGAAVYPALQNDQGCAPGQQVFPTMAGDPPNYAAKGANGPVLRTLLEVLGSTVPSGGTPTAASLRELEPAILALSGQRTYVVLMTDGAPNCNTTLRCGVESCIPNIEHLSVSGMACNASFNCCEPKLGMGDCVDADDTAAAVAEYAAAGVDTFIVGMPGSEEYRTLLGRLAQAGQTARPGITPYYAVSDTNELNLALLRIGAQVAISCDLPLGKVPDNPELVNVYFDHRVVPKDAQDGWVYSGEQSIQLRGSACAELGSGDVLNVQVLSGCPTLVR